MADRPVYFHLDRDVPDPGIVPTDYTVAGGLRLDDLAAVATMLASNKIIGVKIAEFEGTWPDNDAYARPTAGCWTR